MLEVALYLLVALALAVVATLVLPVSLRISVSGLGESGAEGGPPQITGVVALVAGALGVAIRGDGQRWAAHPHLCGLTLSRPVLRRSSTSEKAAQPAVDGEAGAPGGQVEPQAEAAGDSLEAGAASASPLPWRQRLSRLDRAIHMAGPPAIDLARSLPRVVGLRRLRISGWYGFADPCQTGQVFGLLQALGADGWRRVQVEARPDWSEARLRLQVDARARFHLGLLLAFAGRCGLRIGWRWLATRFAAVSWIPARAR